MHPTEYPARFPTAAIDWLSLSLPESEHTRHADDPPLLAVDGTLGTERARERMGYTRACLDVATGGVVYWRGAAPGMGAHVVYSGGALDGLRAREGSIARVAVVAQAILRAGGTVARIDVAYDQQVISPLSVLQADTEGRLLRRSPAPAMLTERRGHGATVSCGRRGGGVYVRCYDKAAEQGVAPHPRGPWWRLEYECRDTLAGQVADAWLADNWERIGALLISACAERVKTGDTNPSRWPIAQAWADTLSAQRGSDRAVSTPPGVTGVIETWAWLETQSGRALAQMAEALGTPTLLARVAHLVDRSRARLTERDRAAIAEYRRDRDAYADEYF